MVSEPHGSLDNLRGQEQELITRSPAMRQLRTQLDRVAASGSAVLLVGEPGVGKGFVATWLHNHSPRAHAACLTIDLTQIPPEHQLVLFGEGTAIPESLGTLCLKHVELLAREAQPALIERARRSYRLVATSSRPIDGLSTCLLPELLATFSEQLRVPPLRERAEDFGTLVASLAALAARRLGRGPIQVSAASVERLARAAWPGNASQVLGVLMAAVEASGGERELSPQLLASTTALQTALAFSPESSYRETRREFEISFERAYVSWLLQRHDGNISAAAREARMDRKHLYDLARNHGLRRPRGNG